MLVNTKEMLENARQGGYALPAPDFIDLDSARVFVQTAERLNKPLILSYAQALKHMLSLEEAAVIGCLLGKQASIPVALHLDHGLDIEFIGRAVELGFTSVMIDASDKSFAENVRCTREVVELAHARNVTVEAEIGHVGQGDNYASFESSESVYTMPEEAVEFVAQTGVDSLAVSIGTVHGIYKNLESPVLSFECLHKLAKNIHVPLVLHGGSGTGDDNLRRCAAEGISKINVLTDFLTGAMEQIKKDSAADYLAVKRAANFGMAEVFEHYYSVFAGN
uniref:class II fructose-bisphosphate aldolase n=1 Tax=Faecalicatena contorta TaxID=39482 RepID=UPI00359C6D29